MPKVEQRLAERPLNEKQRGQQSPTRPFRRMNGLIGLEYSFASAHYCHQSGVCRAFDELFPLSERFVHLLDCAARTWATAGVLRRAESSSGLPILGRAFAYSRTHVTHQTRCSSRTNRRGQTAMALSCESPPQRRD